MEGQNRSVVLEANLGFARNECEVPLCVPGLVWNRLCCSNRAHDRATRCLPSRGVQGSLCREHLSDDVWEAVSGQNEVGSSCLIY